MSDCQRTWLTGAGSGIGRALAERLLARGDHVALSGRNAAPLEDLAANRTNATVLPLDITDREAVRDAGRRLEAALGGLDLVILNAGTCEYFDAGGVDVDMVERVFAANFQGAIHCIDAALPLLRRARAEGGRPLLAATSSAAAYLALPRAEAYGASKAALSHFLEALRLDLHAEGIQISVIHPGFVRTPLTDRNDFPMPMCVEVDQAADAILDGLDHRRLDIHFPRRFTLLVKLIGILPVSLRFRLGRRLSRSRTATEARP